MLSSEDLSPKFFVTELDLAVGRPLLCAVAAEPVSVAGQALPDWRLVSWAPHLYSQTYGAGFVESDEIRALQMKASVWLEGSLGTEMIGAVFGPQMATQATDLITAQSIAGHLARPSGERQEPRMRVEVEVASAISKSPFVRAMRGWADWTLEQRELLASLSTAESPLALLALQTRDSRAQRRSQRHWSSDDAIGLRLWLDDALAFSRSVGGIPAASIESDIRVVAELAIGRTTGLWINGLWTRRLERLLALSFN